METLGCYWKTLTRVWNEHQVESNGAYSVERLIHLRDYSERVTTTHCVFVLILTSRPPLLLCVLLESIPLRSTTDSIENSFLIGCAHQ
ncbi:hypothetical protein PHYSODRAFT_491648 [Phytophthora sojae]|uniref:Uncharacterized protein n=1 Tax=Phytophthora sojae (strain P6497) TaxID=1094619 RepID=G4Z279_PHYSP|nr:hypothetical protein PHYSODRAFT_491648 [Phytophthora sojae]EGZ21414.1 hypothetical protein PHYSODRAFT_491648 [Phytophthora sojae]|eukprot:XP_009524131.1 hypothetical protein PHYSODRAFT_491648 [Phytophthora sojae]